MHHWQMKIKGTLKWYLHLMSYLKTLKSWVTQQRNQKLLIDNYFCEPLISKNKWWWGFFLARELRKMKGTKLVSHKTASDSVPVLWEACKSWGACEGRWEGGESPLSPPPSQWPFHICGDWPRMHMKNKQPQEGDQRLHWNWWYKLNQLNAEYCQQQDDWIWLFGNNPNSIKTGYIGMNFTCCMTGLEHLNLFSEWKMCRHFNNLFCYTHVEGIWCWEFSS